MLESNVLPGHLKVVKMLESGVVYLRMNVVPLSVARHEIALAN
jgi:hypothetical protein